MWGEYIDEKSSLMPREGQDRDRKLSFGMGVGYIPKLLVLGRCYNKFNSFWRTAFFQSKWSILLGEVSWSFMVFGHVIGQMIMIIMLGSSLRCPESTCKERYSKFQIFGKFQIFKIHGKWINGPPDTSVHHFWPISYNISWSTGLKHWKRGNQLTSYQGIN